jgi:ATP-binding cassette, subfamily B, bacterial PglK
MKKTIKKALVLFTLRQKKALIIISFLLLVGMLLEVIGLGILMPTITLILDTEASKNSLILLKVRNLIPSISDQNFKYLFLFAVSILYFVKFIYLSFLTFKQNRFLQNLTAYFSNKLYENYLHQDYNFHLIRNTSELLKNIQTEINLFSSFVSASLSIFIEIGFITSVILTLLNIEFFGAITLAVFYSMLSLIFFTITRSKVKKWGEIRFQIDNKLTKTLLEGLGAIKDLMILGKTNFYAKEYSTTNYQKARLISNQETVNNISRFYLEFISVSGIIFFLLILISQEKNNIELVGVLGVFVASSFRIIPSFNRIINSVQIIRFSIPSVETISKEMNRVDSERKLNFKDGEFKFKEKIEINNLEFNYSDENKILKDINLTIKKGQIVGIIGESGSGKSTLIDNILGLQKPTKGEIKIDGKTGFQLNQSWRRIIGYVSQSIYLTDDTIKNNIALGVPNDEILESRIFDILKDVQLEGFIKKLKFGIHTKVGERGVQLSGGQIQRLGIARALYNSPDILILDEATSALDSQTEKELMECIYNLKGNKTILMIAHRINTLKKCDFLYEVKSN